MPLTEIQTRQEIIDSQLTKAGWGFSSRSLVEEFYIKSNSKVFEKLGHYASKGEFADYVLLDKDNKPLAIVEAKRTNRDSASRVQVATYPSMMQVYERLSVGHYDLIIADETHRSIYNRYKLLFDWFDAIQIGLTATPTDFIDHNTFELFGCDDGVPTFNYSFDQAVADKHLTNYRVYQARTNFQVSGIKAGQLPEHIKNQLQEQGIDLEEINFEGTDIEKKVTNIGTTNAIGREFMDKWPCFHLPVKPFGNRNQVYGVTCFLI